LYWFFDEDKVRGYVGETCDLERRIREHERTGGILPGEKVSFKVAKKGSSSERRREVEIQKINHHRPTRNRRAGGGGRKST